MKVKDKKVPMAFRLENTAIKRANKLFERFKAQSIWAKDLPKSAFYRMLFEKGLSISEAEFWLKYPPNKNNPETNN